MNKIMFILILIISLFIIGCGKISEKMTVPPVYHMEPRYLQINEDFEITEELATVAGKKLIIRFDVTHGDELKNFSDCFEIIQYTPNWDIDSYMTNVVFFKEESSGGDIFSLNLKTKQKGKYLLSINSPYKRITEIEIICVGDTIEEAKELCKGEEAGLRTLKHAEKRFLEAESILKDAKEKDISYLSENNKNFIENLLVDLENKLEESKKELSKAKEYNQEKDYYKATQQAEASSSKASTVIRNSNKILEGRVKVTWVTSTDITSRENCINSGGDWIEEETTRRCDCGENKKYDGTKCQAE